MELETSAWMPGRKRDVKLGSSWPGVDVQLSKK